MHTFCLSVVSVPRLDINKSRPVCLRQESVYDAVMINLSVKYTAISSCLYFSFHQLDRNNPAPENRADAYDLSESCLYTVCFCCTWKWSGGSWIIEWLCCVSVPRWAGTGLRCRVFVCHMSTAPHWGAAYTVLHLQQAPATLSGQLNTHTHIP